MCTESSLDDILPIFNKGDETAFVLIYKTYYPLLIKRAIQRTIDEHVAEDMVQDIFIRMYEKRGVHSNIEGFLFTALERRIYSYWRHEIVHDRYSEIIQRIKSSYGNDVATYVEYKELKESLEKQLDKLPTQCQKIFRLKREEYLSNKEIAQQLNISIKTVEAQITKAMHILRAKFDYEKMFLLLALLAAGHK